MTNTPIDRVSELISEGKRRLGWRIEDEAAPSVAANPLFREGSFEATQALPVLKDAPFDWPRYALLYHAIEMALNLTSVRKMSLCQG